jgi:hypothetical protein
MFIIIRLIRILIRRIKGNNNGSIGRDGYGR